ncbi:MAG TPA: DUF4159 domain-containing protein [Acetobacteraceae bacterium]|nr:DUF4159 domain-containing protein [Acetobacteraceae bacterium]
MIFAAPWVLLALIGLPVLWWLLRVTPPAPRSESFPAIRLLLGLHAKEETPARTPWWLMTLRLLAAALVIVALARPVLNAGTEFAGSGPMLLVLDNGWASASDWARRMQAADSMLDRAARAGRQAALLTTAPGETGTLPRITSVMPIASLRSRLAALRPEPWPADRAAAAAALDQWHHAGAAVVYLADGLTDGSDFPRFSEALRHAGSVTELCCAATAARMLLPPDSNADRLVVRLAQVPQPAPTSAVVLAQTGDGRTLARTPLDLPAGAAIGSAPLMLPPEIRNELARLVLQGSQSAGSVFLLDERYRRRPVGLAAGDAVAANTPFVGSLYFVSRALQPYAELREGSLDTLLKRKLSVLILADDPLPAGPERAAVAKWVEQGGLLIRFAGSRTAEQPIGETDPLMPVPLLQGDRALGGAMSWSKPAGLAPFPPNSPFAGLDAPADVTVNRQVLAQPSADLAAHTWAALKDGTPLVTEATKGAGRIVLFHVTANVDWSNLPLSGLFVDMLRRLVSLSVGVKSEPPHTLLSPAETLDGFGMLGAPPQSATGLRADEFGQAMISPRHPPGLYGPENGRQALNLGAGVTAPTAAPMVAGARVEQLESAAPERELGPPLLAIAVLLLAIDMLVALALRGLLRTRMAAIAVPLLLLAGIPRAHALETVANPALATRLGYILTGDAQVDEISRQGLEGLSEYVDGRTAAILAEPDGVVPGKTHLSFYPLLYWPITPDAPALTPQQTAALNRYMSNGGIILIDTRDSGSGAGFAPGSDAALRRVAKGLVIPPLAPLTTADVLSRTFYLLHDFPGRYTGATVWVQRDPERSNDSVSPVVIGGNDWAAAWAVDGTGRNPYAAIPGGTEQRTMAYRFGVNLVMYALTGNYKGDQVHVPAILERLGQ